MSRQREYQRFRDLVVYQKSYQLAKEIHEVSKTFPKEERYSLTDQIRRASRSIPVTIAEAWKKRRYPKAFISKLTDSSAESGEVTVWLDFALDFGYIDQGKYAYFQNAYTEVSKMIHGMIDHPDKFTW